MRGALPSPISLVGAVGKCPGHELIDAIFCVSEGHARGINLDE